MYFAQKGNVPAAMIDRAIDRRTLRGTGNGKTKARVMNTRMSNARYRKTGTSE